MCQQANTSQLLKCAKTQVTVTVAVRAKTESHLDCSHFINGKMCLTHTYTLGLILKPYFNVRFFWGYADYQKNSLYTLDI